LIIKMRINNKIALTLVELLLATALTGIIMLGIVGFSIAIKGFQESGSKAMILTMKINAAMSNIAKDAYFAVGDTTNSGVRTYQDGLAQSICFRQDRNNPVTPEVYTDDTWVCYYHGFSFGLKRYDDPNEVEVPCRPAINNCGSAEKISDVFDLEENIFFNIVEDSQGRLQYIEIQLVGLYDKDEIYDPINNPRDSLLTRISPPGHGR